MSFDPDSITSIQFGDVDYPAGEAIKGDYGWHIMEIALEENGYWENRYTQDFVLFGTVEDVIRKMAGKQHLSFAVDTTWHEFKPFIEQFGSIPDQIYGSFNGEDFEELISQDQ